MGTAEQLGFRQWARWDSYLSRGVPITQATKLCIPSLGDLRQNPARPFDPEREQVRASPLGTVGTGTKCGLC